jgi:hypothetical protein
MVRMECILDKCDKSAAFATFLLNLNLAIDVGCRRRDLDLTLVNETTLSRVPAAR